MKKCIFAALFAVQASSSAMEKWTTLIPKIDRLPPSSKEWVHNACGDRSGWSDQNHRQFYPFCFATIKIVTEINERLLKQQEKKSSSGQP